MSSIERQGPEEERQVLENEKLRCEIDRIRLEIRNSERRWRMEFILKAGALLGVLGILPPNIAKTAAGRASCGFWRPITYRLSAGSHQSIPLNPQVLAIHLSVRMCIYPGG